MEIEVVVSKTDIAGQKGIFDAGEVSSSIVRQSVSGLAASFRDFCNAFAQGLAAVEEMSNKYQLEKVELSVDITAKGEVRLIASASAETKGSIKLIFARQA